MKKILLFTSILFLTITTSLFAQHPTGLASTNVTSSSVDLSWDDSMCPLTVNLKYRITGSGGPGWVNLTSVSSPHTLSGLLPSTSYQVLVKCVGNSGWSNIFTFTTLAVVNGCTDISACNFDASANVDDGSCTYSTSSTSNVTACDDYTWNGQTYITSGIYTYTIPISVNCDSTATLNLTINISTSSSTIVTTCDAYFWNGTNYTSSGTYTYVTPNSANCDSTVILDLTINICNVFGCTDVLACNYNVAATVDDGSCSYYGCTDSLYVEYDASVSVTCSDNSACINLLSIVSINTAFISKPILCYIAGLTDPDAEMVIEINQTDTTIPTAYKLIVGYFPFAGYFTSHLIADEVANWGNVNLSGFKPNIDYCIRIVDSAVYYTANGGSSSGISTTGIYDEYCFINFSEPSQLVASTSFVTNNLCTGDCIATQELTIQGGTQPHYYTLDANPIVNAGAQSYNIDAGDYFYTPQSLNINVGDTVNWINVGGFHNVNFDANTITGNSFNNPVSFISSPTSNSALYTHIFTLAGTYSYDCSVGNHAALGMIGTITVNGTTSNTSVDTLINLCAGTFNLVVSDSNSCTTSPEITNFIIAPIPEISTAGTIADFNGFNVSCNGFSDGTITASASGGTGLFTYSIDVISFQSSPIFSSLSSGTYTITYKDANDCIEIEQFSLTEPPILSGTANVTSSIDCYNDTTGEITFLVDAVEEGVPLYDYSINGIDFFTDNEFDLLPGDLNYTVIIRDLNLCMYSSSVYLPEPTQISFSTILSNYNSYEVSCSGVDDGTIEFVSTSGGLPPYQYSTDGVTFGIVVSYDNLAAGVYSIAVKDATTTSDCIVTGSVALSDPGLFSVSYSVDNAIDCPGDCDGEISIIPTNGVGIIDYDLTGLPTTTDSVFNSLCGDLTNTNGSYTLDAEDENGCVITATIISLPEPAEFDYDTLSVDDLCLQENGEAIIENESGGTGIWSYLWSDGQTTSTATDLAAGVYTVLVSDENNCSFTESVTVLADTGFMFTMAFISPCSGYPNSGSAKVSAAASSTYTYQWFDSNGDAILGETSDEIIDIPLGTYSIEVTDINTTCTKVGSIEIMPDDNPIVIDSLVFTNFSCYGIDDAQIEIFASGGETIYNYSISNGLNSQPDSVFEMLAPNIYILQAIDANGCFDDTTITLSYPGLLEIDSTVFTHISCFGLDDGTVQNIQFVGGTGPFEFSIDGSPAQTYMLFSGLDAGQHTVEVFDVNNCASSDLITVIEPTLFEVETTTSNWNNYQIRCNGDSLGYVDIISSGGTVPYFTDGITFTNTITIDNLWAGNHTFIVQDANGCPYQETIFFNEPDSIQHNFISTHINCVSWDNGSVTDSVYGGVGSATTYSYLWDSGETTYSLANLTTGTYTITVTDENGCEDTDSVIINDDYVFKVDSLSGSNVGCFDDCDGELSVEASGGVPFTGSTSYTYLWNDYLGQNTVSAVGLCVDSIFLSTVYNCIVTDAVGCSDTFYFTLNQPEELKVDILIDSLISCNGDNDGQLTASATLGTPIADTSLFSTYNLNIDLVSNTNPITFTTPITTNNIDYLLVVTGEYMHDDSTSFNLDAAYDYSDTTAIMDWTLNGISNIRPFPDVYSPIHTYNYPFLGDGAAKEFKFSDSLYSGSLQFKLYEINYIYNYYWSTGGTDSIISDLFPGIYKVTIEDANMCRDTFEIYLNEPNVVEISTQEFDISCFGDNDGSIKVLGSGGTSFESTYSYMLYSGSTMVDFVDDYVSGSISPTHYEFDSLAPGNYYVIAKDRNDCEVTSLFLEITEPFEPLTLLVDTVDETCLLDDGIIRMFPEGGSQSFNYFINGNQENSNIIDSLAPGWYAITVEDTRGCEVIDSTFIRSYRSIFLPDTLINIDTAICLGQSIIIDVDERPGLIYTWNDGELGADHPDRNIQPQGIFPFGEEQIVIYTLIVTDPTRPDCDAHENNVTVKFSPIDPMLNSNPAVEYGAYPIVLSGDNINLFSENNNCIEYTWQWSNDTITNTNVSIIIQEISETDWYYLKVKDADGCLGYDSIYVVVGIKPYEAITPNNDGLNDTWTPLDIKSYEQALVQVFNRWGGLVFESIGGGNYQAWDGTNNGKELAVGTYYYIIDLNTGDEPQTGPVTIIR